MANSTATQDAIVRSAAFIKSHSANLEQTSTDYQQGMVSHARAVKLMREEMLDIIYMIDGIKFLLEQPHEH